MPRIVSKTGPFILGWVPFSTLLHDVLDVNKNKDNANESSMQETGWDRVKNIFKTNEATGSVSKELLTIYAYATGGVVIGAIFGGIVNTRTATQDFIDRNMASRFLSNMDAKRRMRDYITIKLAGGVKDWCPKITAFTTLYGASTVILNAYRGEATVSNYILGGMITGGLFKMNLGITGVIAGTIVGGILSGVMSGTALMLIKLSGISMDELLAYHKTRHDKRKGIVETELEPTTDGEELDSTNSHTSNKKAGRLQNITV